MTVRHMLWIGDRTRELDGAHVEFFKRNSETYWLQSWEQTMVRDELIRLIDFLNPIMEKVD